eukprot:gene25510-biopygen12004
MCWCSSDDTLPAGAQLQHERVRRRRLPSVRSSAAVYGPHLTSSLPHLVLPVRTPPLEDHCCEGLGGGVAATAESATSAGPRRQLLLCPGGGLPKAQLSIRLSDTCDDLHFPVVFHPSHSLGVATETRHWTLAPSLPPVGRSH